MSVLGKRWKIKNNDARLPLRELLLKNRGIETAEAAEKFFNPSKNDLHDPFLMPDMAKAVERITEAIEKSQRIMIFGDYDLDGITGTAILMRTLTKLGATVSYRLPHRIDDGYGLRKKFVEQFAALGVGLIITVDNGISALEAIRHAQKIGIDVIITDHHTVPEQLPPACAILHPKLPGTPYPYPELTGSAVALKLAEALFRSLGADAEDEIYKMLDLACIGTIGDFGPLIGENRYIVKEGLRVLANTRWPGLSRLKQLVGINGSVDTFDVGFLIGPRLNAAGRMSHAHDAIALLLNGEEHAHDIALHLEQLNRKRQKLTETLMEIVHAQVEHQKKDAIIIVQHPKFHAGVIGILAARIVEEYGKPAIVMEERSTCAIGSCRSIDGFNIIETLQLFSQFLTHFGGHAKAAGFEVETKKLENFVQQIKQHVKEGLIVESVHGNPAAVLEIDCELEKDQLTTTAFSLVESFQPFGPGNEKPRFLYRAVSPRNLKKVGAAAQHIKFTINAPKIGILDCIGFKLGSFSEQISNSQSIDIVCELEFNEWQGKTRHQLKIIDFA